MGNTSENPVRNHYFHAPARVPEHKADLDDQAKNPDAPREGTGEKGLPMQGVIFQRKDIMLLNKALRNPNHRLRDAAIQAMHGFTMAAKKDEITTLNQAEKEYGIPNNTLSDWVAKGIIPYENRDEYAVYVRRGVLDKIAPVYHHAKEQRKLAGPMLKKMRDELFPDSSTNPRKS
jgi:hypothetical protein